MNSCVGRYQRRIWVISVTLGSRLRLLDFHYAPFAIKRRAAMRYVAMCQLATTRRA